MDLRLVAAAPVKVRFSIESRTLERENEMPAIWREEPLPARSLSPKERAGVLP